MKKGKLLFYGELSPDSVHGVAISNTINLRMLEPEFLIHIIREKSNFGHHDRITLSKIFRVSGDLCSIALKSLKSKYLFFYSVFSLSVFGGIKTLGSVLLFRFFNRGTIVLHIHRGDFFSRYYKSWVNRVISRLIFFISDRIIILSESQKSSFEQVAHKPVYVLYNTIEKEYPFQSKKETGSGFIYISNYLREKGIVDLLNVFSKLSLERPELHLNTYGNFSDEKLKDSILAFASGNIEIGRAVYEDEKFRILSGSGCLILPSWNEGLPLVLLEAISVGTPVIASDTGFVKEITGSDYPFLFKPGDKKSLESAILKFLEYGKAKELSDSLNKTYNDKFSNCAHNEILTKIFI